MPSDKAIAWMLKNGIDPDGDGWKPDVAPEESVAIIRKYDRARDGPIRIIIEEE